MDPFLAEIRIFGFNFSPYGWAFCNGSILSISQNQALFSLVGTNYGGNGVTTFGLPNLQDSAPIDQGQAAGGQQYVVGQTGGQASVTLTTPNLPAHTHPVGAINTTGTSNAPAAGELWAGAPAGGGKSPTPTNYYSTTQPLNVGMAGSAIGVFGGSQPHNNLPPYLALNFCIATQGIYPTRG